MYRLRNAHIFLVVQKQSFNVTLCKGAFLGILSQKLNDVSSHKMSQSNEMIIIVYTSHTHDPPQKTCVSPPHMLWSAHNTKLCPDSLVLYSPKLHGTGHNETLYGDSKISNYTYWCKKKYATPNLILILPNKCIQEDVLLSLETCLQGGSLSHTSPLRRLSATLCLLSAGASFMAFSISGDQYAYAFIYFVLTKMPIHKHASASQHKCYQNLKPLILAPRHLKSYPSYLVLLSDNSHNRHLVKIQ